MSKVASKTITVAEQDCQTEKEESRCGISAGEVVESREVSPRDEERLSWHNHATLATSRKKPGKYESSERALRDQVT